MLALRFLCGLSALSLMLVLVACSKREGEVKVYRLEKAPREAGVTEADTTPSMPTDLPPSHPPIGGASVSATSNPPVTSIVPGAAVPASWEAQPLSEMRKASYLVHGADGASADISLVTLGGTAGDVLANVNRWLGQLGQPPMKEEQLARVVQHLPGELGHVAIVDLQGLPEQGDPKKDGRIVAAIATGEGATSFYKMRGNTDLVGTEKENFLQWVTATLERR